MDINNEILKGKIYECNSGKTCNLKNIAKNVLSLRDSIKKEDLDIAINKLKTINNVYLAVSSQEILDVIRELFGGVKECQEFATKEFLGMSSFEYNSPICKIHVYCEKALGVGTYLFYDLNGIKYSQTFNRHLFKEGFYDKAKISVIASLSVKPESVLLIEKRNA